MIQNDRLFSFIFFLSLCFLSQVGISSKDVGLKVNSRKVLGAVLRNAGVPDDRFTETCVVIDKLDKVGAAEVVKELTGKIELQKAAFESLFSQKLRTLKIF